MLSIYSDKGNHIDIQETWARPTIHALLTATGIPNIHSIVSGSQITKILSEVAVVPPNRNGVFVNGANN